MLLLNYLLILKMMTETLLKIPFSVIGLCFQRRPRIGFGENVQELTCHTGGFQHFSVKIATIGFLKWVTGMIFKISK
jgi:hypothetical protein